MPANIVPLPPSSPEPSPGRFPQLRQLFQRGINAVTKLVRLQGRYCSKQTTTRRYNPWTGKWTTITRTYMRDTTKLGNAGEVLEGASVDEVAGAFGEIVDAVKGQGSTGNNVTGEASETGAPQNPILSALNLFGTGTSKPVGPAAIVNSLANHLGIKPSSLEAALKTLAGQQEEKEKLELGAIFSRARSGDATEIIKAAKEYVVEKQGIKEEEIIPALGTLLEKYGGFEAFVQRVAAIGNKEKPNNPDIAGPKTEEIDPSKPS